MQSAYADVLQYINPETATLEQIEGQFRRYTPRGQRERMVVLFRNLCVYTGIIPSSGEDGHIDTVPRQRQSKPAATRERTMTQERKPPSPPKPNGDRASTPVRHPECRPLRHAPVHPTLLEQLPDVGGEWSAEDRKSWITFAESGFNMLFKLPDGDV